MEKHIKLILIICALLVGIIAAIGFSFVWHSPAATKHVSKEHKPSFSFNKDLAPGWWGGRNNWSNANDYTDGQVAEENIPVVDTVVYQGVEGDFGECFVRAFYMKGSVDVEAAVNEKMTGMVKGEKDTSAVKQVAKTQQTMKTSEGVKEYILHHYDLNLGDAYKGNAFGFIPLNSGYIEVRSICKQTERLPGTFVALAAISFNR